MKTMSQIKLLSCKHLHWKFWLPNIFFYSVESDHKFTNLPLCMDWEMTHRALRFSALTYTYYYTCTNKHKGKGPHLSNSKGGSFVACTGCLRPPCTLPTAMHTGSFLLIYFWERKTFFINHSFGANQQDKNKYSKYTGGFLQIYFRERKTLFINLWCKSETNRETFGLGFL